MTETTAKKGMVRFKSGFSKNDFDYDFLSQVNYDDSRKLVNVIEALFGEIKSMKETINAMKVDRDKFMAKYQTLEIEHDSMKTDVKSLKTFSLD